MVHLAYRTVKQLAACHFHCHDCDPTSLLMIMIATIDTLSPANRVLMKLFLEPCNDCKHNVKIGISRINENLDHLDQVDEEDVFVLVAEPIYVIVDHPRIMVNLKPGRDSAVF